MATTRYMQDIVANLIGVLATPTMTNHAAIVDLLQLGALSPAIAGYDVLFVLPGELRHADGNRP
jgi:hypothetical protein